MRSATIFWVFGGIILLVFGYSALSSYFDSRDPVVHTALQFLSAVKKQDVETVTRMTDTSNVRIITTGKSLTGFSFPVTAAFQGVFSKQPAVKWTNGEILQLTPKPGIDPVVAETQGVATVIMTNNCKLYLRRQKDKSWKVFYIAKPEVAKQ